MCKGYTLLPSSVCWFDGKSQHHKALRSSMFATKHCREGACQAEIVMYSEGSVTVFHNMLTADRIKMLGCCLHRILISRIEIEMIMQ